MFNAKNMPSSHVKSPSLSFHDGQQDQKTPSNEQQQLAILEENILNMNSNNDEPKPQPVSQRLSNQMRSSLTKGLVRIVS